VAVLPDSSIGGNRVIRPSGLVRVEGEPRRRDDPRYPAAEQLLQVLEISRLEPKVVLMR
jgi:hypothetical protein